MAEVSALAGVNRWGSTRRTASAAKYRAGDEGDEDRTFYLKPSFLMRLRNVDMANLGSPSLAADHATCLTQGLCDVGSFNVF